jgi:hypothetical protein
MHRDLPQKRPLMSEAFNRVIQPCVFSAKIGDEGKQRRGPASSEKEEGVL